jgi:hypothetical protein
MLQVFFTGMVFAGDVRKKVSCNSHAIHSCGRSDFHSQMKKEMAFIGFQPLTFESPI